MNVRSLIFFIQKSTKLCCNCYFLNFVYFHDVIVPCADATFRDLLSLIYLEWRLSKCTGCFMIKNIYFILASVIILDVCVAYSLGLPIRFGGPGDMPMRGQADHGFQGNRFSANRNNDRFGVQDRFVCD